MLLHPASKFASKSFAIAFPLRHCYYLCHSCYYKLPYKVIAKITIAIIYMLTLMLFHHPSSAKNWQNMNIDNLKQQLSEEIALKIEAEKIAINYLRISSPIEEPATQYSPVIQSIHIDPRIKKFTAEIGIKTTGDNQKMPLKTQATAEGRYEIHQFIPVANRNIAKGEILKLNDLTKIAYPVRKIRGNTAIYPEDIEGMEAKRSLQMHQIISKTALIKPIVVRKGQLINTAYISQNMVINIEAEALRDGSIKEVIEFRNIETKKIFSAKIFDANNVIINYQTNSPIYEAEKIMLRLPQTLD